MTAAIYARVSTQDQDCAMQLTELRGFAARMDWQVVEYVEKASGKRGSNRPVLARLMADARLRKFDIVLVWKMDRFGRSLQDLITNVQALAGVGIRFLAPSQGIDTDVKSPIGKLMLHIMGAFAEFERDLIVERVQSGLTQYGIEYKAGKAVSRSGKNLAIGRPRRIFMHDQAVAMHGRGMSLREIGRELKISYQTVRRAVTKPVS